MVAIRQVWQHLSSNTWSAVCKQNHLGKKKKLTVTTVVDTIRPAKAAACPLNATI